MRILEEEPPLSDQCKLPWITDAFLYPISASGMLHVAIFVFLPRIVSFFVGLLARFLGPYLQQGTFYIIAFLTAPFYIVFGSYVVYYVVNCVIDSAKGNRRATDVTLPANIDAGDLIAQVFLLFGCVAICFWPAAIYYVLTKQTDSRFMLLAVCGTFFLPMSFLRGVMFDSFDALNPILIIQSICKTFLSYCGLVLFFLVLGGFIEVILPHLPLWGFLSAGIEIYLVFVLAHRVGWFYWWHKDKLNWGL